MSHSSTLGLPTDSGHPGLSPGGAAVGSQGREPLGGRGPHRGSPGGAAVTFAPPGLAHRGPRFQGLTPLATDGRPSGAKAGVALALLLALVPGAAYAQEKADLILL